MTHYMRNGNQYQVAPEGMLDITELLPLGTYKVGYAEPFDRYFLEKIDDFEIKGKVYGDVVAKRDRILRTFDDRPSGTGVLLSGEKGSGKTMLARMLSLQAQETGIPTILINDPWHGDTFNAFVQAIEQPAVVLFDEFEKTYNSEQQEKLLTLLDGVYASKKLFVLTCNDKWRIDTHMRNRPGRIFYRLDFGGLDLPFVREYVADTLENQDHAESVLRASALFTRFNFDILKALVEEMNRFGEDADAALEMLNAKPEMGDDHTYTVAIRVDGRLIPAERVHNDGRWRGNPLQDTVRVYVEGLKRNETTKGDASAPFPTRAISWENVNPFDEDVPGAGGREIIFRSRDLKRVHLESGVFEFQNADGVVAELTEVAGRVAADYSIAY